MEKVKKVKKVKLANFDDPKWTYNDLKSYARKYISKLNEKNDVPDEIKDALFVYQTQYREKLIRNLKTVQSYLYK